MQGYEVLAGTILRQTYHDLRRGAYGSHRGTYLNAKRFLDTPLFRLLCRLAGGRPETVRREMLRLAVAHRLACPLDGLAASRHQRAGRTDRPTHSALKESGTPKG